MNDFGDFPGQGEGQIHDMQRFMTDAFEPQLGNNSMVQSPILPAAPFKKSKWTPDEDKLLIESVKLHGMGNWSLVAQGIPGRTGKQCRERWINQLSPALNKDNWTAQEDAILIQQQRMHGNVWSKIAQFLPGRSANSVKNRWSWLSRHRVPPSLAAQMMPYIVQQQQKQQDMQRMPPMPQIFHPQQTAPTERLWRDPPGGNRIPFSDPLEPIYGETTFSVPDVYGFSDIDGDLFPPASRTPNAFDLEFQDDSGQDSDQQRLDSWSDF